MHKDARPGGTPIRIAIAASVVGLTVAATGIAEAKGGKGGGGGDNGGGTNNYNSVIHDIAKLNQALQGDVVGFGVRTGGHSDSYEGHPPSWLNLHSLSQRETWCRERHPSYNPATGTYTTYSGHQRRCVVP